MCTENNISCARSTESSQTQNQYVLENDPNDQTLISALESGDFQTALKLLPKDSPSPPTVGPDNLTPLHYACQHGRADIALLLITEYNYSINSRSKAGQTPLHFAAKYGQVDVKKLLLQLLHAASLQGHLDIVKYLVDDCKCNPSCADQYGITPLHDASQQGHLDIVKYLVDDCKCNPSCTNQDGKTSLHLASLQGRLDVVKHLVDDCKCNPSCADQDGKTSLHLASLQGHLNVVKYLVDKCNPSCADQYGITPLHLTSLQGHLDIVKYLVDDCKCNPSCADQYGITPLHLTSLQGHLDIVKYLVGDCKCNPSCTDQYGISPLHLASLQGHLDIVKYLVGDCKCNPSCTDQYGISPLHLTSLQGHLDIVKYLVGDCKCNPSCTDQYGITPLHLASQKGPLVIVKYFLKCKPSCSSVDGTTPLTPGGHLEVVKYFINEKGCDPMCRDKFGITLLHRAALGGHLEIVKYFINEKGCDPMCRDQWGGTPLHCASQKGHLEIVKYLIDEQNVDPSCHDMDNTTPLHFASKQGHLDIVEYLVAQKLCDPTIQSENGTPADLALDNNHSDVACYLISKGGTVRIGEIKALKGVAISPHVKIHVLGNSGSGKSSLVKALQGEHSLIAGRFFNVAGVALKTCGIIPVDFHSKMLGRITLYDFAGDEEYYSGHGAILESSTHPVVLLIVDLYDCPDKIRKAISYWESLVGNAVSNSSCHVRMIIVGSHTDMLSTHDLQSKAAILLAATRSSSNYKNIEHVNCVTLDCRKSSSSGITQLRHLLQSVCKSVRIEARFDYKNAVILNSFIDGQLKSTKVCVIKKLLSWILESTDPKMAPLKQPSFLYNTCESLNTSGHILLLRNKERPQESWLILQKEAILSNVHGLLKYIKLSSTSGIISMSQLTLILKKSGVELHIDLVRCYLVQMEFCIEIDLELLELMELSCIQEKCLLFPDLLRDNKPADLWQLNAEFTYSYTFGWGLKCTKSLEFFTPRFLQVLLIRLARFALNPHPESQGLLEPAQGCRMWKKGIFWQDAWGVEVIVEISQQNTVVNVMMRCLRGSETKLIQMRSSVIEQVIHIQEHTCAGVNPREYLIHPNCLQHYPMLEVLELPLKDIVDAIVKRKPYLLTATSTSSCKSNYVSIRKMLHFEPYQALSVELIQQFFEEQNADKRIPQDALLEIAEALGNEWKILSDLVPRCEFSKVQIDDSMNEAQKCLYILKLWSGKGGTYGNLRLVLDQYSIFAGRAPLAISSHLVPNTANADHSSLDAHLASLGGGIPTTTHPQPVQASGTQPISTFGGNEAALTLAPYLMSGNSRACDTSGCHPTSVGAQTSHSRTPQNIAQWGIGDPRDVAAAVLL